MAKRCVRRLRKWTCRQTGSTPDNTVRFEQTRPRPSVPLGRSIMRGLLNTLPGLRQRQAFRPFLKTVDHCAACGEAMHHHRADDLPPYIVVVVIGHVVLGGFMLTDMVLSLCRSGCHLAIWVPITILGSLGLDPADQGWRHRPAMGAAHARLRRPRGYARRRSAASRTALRDGQRRRAGRRPRPPITQRPRSPRPRDAASIMLLDRSQAQCACSSAGATRRMSSCRTFTFFPAGAETRRTIDSPGPAISILPYSNG